jgi:BMFP domain-containing protein YqiC
MADRPRFFDDLAGLAGGALSAVSGLRDEIEAMVRARIDEKLRRLELVRREEMEVAMEMAARARSDAEAAAAAVAALEARVAALEARPEGGRRATRATPDAPS